MAAAVPHFRQLTGDFLAEAAHIAAAVAVVLACQEWLAPMAGGQIVDVEDYRPVELNPRLAADTVENAAAKIEPWAVPVVVVVVAAVVVAIEQTIQKLEVAIHHTVKK